MAPTISRESSLSSVSSYDSTSSCESIIELTQKQIDLWNFLTSEESDDRLKNLSQEHPNVVGLLIVTDLASSLLGHRNSDGTPRAIRIEADGHPALLVEGNWIRYDDFIDHDRISIDPIASHVEDRMTAKGELLIDDEEVVCSGTRGLIKKSAPPSPLLVLTEEEHTRLLNHAHGENSANGERVAESVVQLVTTYPELTRDEDRWIRSGIRDTLKPQCHIRLFIKDSETGGSSMHSISLNVFKEERANLGPDLGDYLATCTGHILFDESMEPSSKQIITSLPADTKKVESILEEVKKMQQLGGIRYNRLRQNTPFFASELLAKIGKKGVINHRESVSSLAWNLLPNFEEIPYLGRVLCISRVAICSITNFATKLVPGIVKWPIGLVISIIKYIPNKVSTYMVNRMAIKLGGQKGTQTLISEQFFKAEEKAGLSHMKKHPIGKTKMGQFGHMVPNTQRKTMFDPKVTTIHTARPILEWQHNQSATIVHNSNGQPPRVRWI